MITILPIAEADFATIRSLADVIWHEHYGRIITHAQIDYMLAGRYSDDNLRRYVGAPDRCMWIVRHAADAIGYCACSLAPGETEAKLEQVYLLADRRGGGVGGRMIFHAEEYARGLGARSIFLTVNKANTGSVAVYERRGYAIREAAVFDIGGGYVMDDYVMAKTLG